MNVHLVRIKETLIINVDQIQAVFKDGDDLIVYFIQDDHPAKIKDMSIEEFVRKLAVE